MIGPPIALAIAAFLVPQRAENHQPALRVLDAAAMSSVIDAYVQERQQRDGIQPAPVADDPEFFRRLCLDLIGRIPTVAELKDFLDDKRQNKRQLWINEILDGADYRETSAQHFAHYYRALLLPATDLLTRSLARGLEAWLARELKAGTPYDRLVRELFVGPEASSFSRAYDDKPENLAGSTARLFLGVKLECAQCHDDRSGAPWTRRQFWEFAAFFQSAAARTQANAGAKSLASIQIPGSNVTVDARFLDGSLPAFSERTSPRKVLAEWMTRADNPWFARSAVNRTWQYFLGTGLIEPVDGLGRDDHPASHPELLEELTRQFVAHGYDLKYIVRAITGSQAYQRTSRLTHPSQQEPYSFARAALRGLSPEQVSASFFTATGMRDMPTAAWQRNTAREQVFDKFSDPHEAPTDAPTSIQQALFLLNGKPVADATHLEQSDVLNGALRAESPAQQLEVLYLAVLSRPPRPEESERLLPILSNASADAKNPSSALRDVFWALLNSPEFILNR